MVAGGSGNGLWHILLQLKSKQYVGFIVREHEDKNRDGPVFAERGVSERNDRKVILSPDRVFQHISDKPQLPHGSSEHEWKANMPLIDVPKIHF